MAIKRSLKVDTSFSAASMTDLIFLLLLFLLMATTLITPNALKLVLPQSNNQVKDKPYTTVSITPDLMYFVEDQPVAFDQLEDVLKSRLSGTEKPVISLQTDEQVPVGEVVRVMNMVNRNRWQMILATRPE